MDPGGLCAEVQLPDDEDIDQQDTSEAATLRRTGRVVMVAREALTDRGKAQLLLALRQGAEGELALLKEQQQQQQKQQQQDEQQQRQQEQQQHQQQDQQQQQQEQQQQQQEEQQQLTLQQLQPVLQLVEQQEETAAGRLKDFFAHRQFVCRLRKNTGGLGSRVEV
ncbi:hypothetical protein Emed_007111 [Eimeria media]